MLRTPWLDGFFMCTKFKISLLTFIVLSVCGCNDQIHSAQNKSDLENLTNSQNDQSAKNSKTADDDSIKVNGLMATHCNKNEEAYINAKMQKVLRNPTPNEAYRLVPSGKVMSICVAKDRSSLTYRFGKSDTVEFEKSATVGHPFGSYFRQTGRVSESILFFSNGAYHYYITNSGGMGSGVSVDVYKDNKLVTEFFSGNDSYNDFIVATNMSLPKDLVKEQQPLDKPMQ